MSNQSKVTDFFVAQKKTENPFKSVKKNTQIVGQSVVNDIDSPAVKTPKRKKVVTKSSDSSKRKKTPKIEVKIEFRSEGIETKNEIKEEVIASNTKTTEDVKTKKQMTAEEIKEKLLKCNNLAKLKKQLSTINDCAAKVKQFKEMKVKTPTKKVIRTPNRQNRSSSKGSPIRPLLSNTPITAINIPPLKSPLRLTLNVDTNGPQTYRRRLFDVFEDEKSSPQKKTDNKSRPAFERFNYLVDTSEDGLVLPQKFKLLSDFFKSMDTIVSMHYKRQEVCTFDKLKVSVERMTGRKFDTKKLSQIQTVFSDAFKLKYELFSSILSNQKPSQQLVISPNYNSNVNVRFDSRHLLERHQMFVNKLLDITKRHHKQYLNGLGINVDDKDIVRWHPKFRLDSVPDIEANDNSLPVKPKFGDNSAEIFLETSRQRLGISSATVTTDPSKDVTTGDEQTNDNKMSADSNKKVTKGLLKGISMDLLNKIRAKEAANLAQEMTRKPEVERELRILRTLPEFIRIIHSFLVGSKKLAVPYDELIDKIINSFNSSISILRAREHVDYLLALLPEWICLLEVKKGNYIKINKQTNISILEERVKYKINNLKNANNF